VLVPLTDYIALVSLTRDVPTRDLMRTAAAVQKQVTRDFAPHWHLVATVDAFEDLASVPSDYHPVIVFGDAADLADRLGFAIGGESAAALIDQFDRDQVRGVHLNEFTRQPFALVAVSEMWPVTVSHEVLELLANPYGNRLVAATHPVDRERRVNYVLEVCDPPLSIWYPVNGVPVSDFYTPRYFDPVRTAETLYSFTGSLAYPLQILEGGYVSWIDLRDSALYQLQAGESEPVLLADRADLLRSTVPLRTLIDNDPQTPQVQDAVLRPASSAAGAAGVYGGVIEASEGAALRTREALFSLATGLG
jgi:hypothetical protein